MNVRPGQRRLARPSVVISRRTPCKLTSWPALRRVLFRILEDHGARGVLGIALVGDEEMRRIHKDFLGLDTPTDVISFPLESAGKLEHDDVFGQVVVSVDTARREARSRRLSLEREVALYAVHGTLHLVGHDDLEPRKKRAMRRAERRYLDLLDAPAATSRSRSSRRPAAHRPRKKRRPARA